MFHHPSPNPDSYEPLHPREVEILRLISKGLTDREIAGKLNLSIETIKWYNKQAYAKLEVSNRTEAVAVASQFNLLAPSPVESVLIPLRSNHNLPAPINSFIGRATEIKEIQELLRKNRLLVLTGPGGTGKTRLALEVARSLVEQYQHGVWWVELAPISDASLVPDAIVQALGINMTTSQTAIEVLKHFLHNKNILLLMDNFEHLLDSTLIVGDLLAGAAQLSILATSRERLNLYGEQEYPVHPMRIPGAGHVQSLDQLLGYDACNLFYQRAKTVKPGIGIDQGHANAIAQLCIRLDGLPLAVELAASHVRLFSPVALLEQLKGNLASLPDGPRDLPARQRTLYATIDWSYQLLRDDEKLLFARLSVFSGGATLAAIQQICAGDIPGIMNILVGVLNKNLAYSREDATGEPRIGLLETIREYAAAMLAASGETEAIRQSHAAYFTAIAEQARREIRSSKGRYWYLHLRLEQDNLRSAIAWSLSGMQLSYCMRIIASLKDYWCYTGTAMEGMRWITAATKVSNFATPELVGGLELCAAHVSLRIGDYEHANDHGQRALEIYRSLGDELNIAWCLEFMSIITHLYQKHSPESLAMIQEALSIFRLHNYQPGITQALNSMGEIHRFRGEIQAAKDCYEECLAYALQSGDQLRQSILFSNLSLIAFKQRDYEKAARLILSSIRIVVEQDNLYGIATYIQILVGPTAALGDGRRAARLLGVSHAMLQNMGAVPDPTDELEIVSYAELTRTLLDKQAFEKAWQEGLAMSVQEVISYALEETEIP